MAQQFAISNTAPRNPRFADAFVIFAVSVLSLAVGACLLVQLGLALWFGTLAALAVYSVLLSLHLIVRRSFAVAPMPLRPDHRGWVSQAMANAEAQRSAPSQEELPQSSAREMPGKPTLAPPSAEAGARRRAQAPAADLRREPMQARPRDPFHFRPSREPSLSAPVGHAPAGAGMRTPRQSEETSPEMSVEVIQDLIKKLADELNNTAPPTEPARRANAAAQPTAPPKETPAAPQASGAPAREPGVGLPPRPKSNAPSRGEGDAAQKEPPALNPQLARVTEAVAAQRMEVLLEPIHALAEGRPRHVELSVRLITADGGAIEQSEFSRIVRGTGLMPRIDAARMVRAARVARRLGDRGRQGSVLTLIDANSLTDEGFLTAAAVQPPTQATMGLVLSFAQSEVRAFTPGHARALKILSTAGFRFALEEVTDLDMDFAGLKKMGVDFVKLDAPVFLEGLPVAGGRVPASDICRHLADFGLTLIVGRIEDDWLLARILGFGVLFGKGALFGAPRQVKDEIVAEPAKA